MPKLIINNFSGGLYSKDKNAPENTYYEGREIDLYRDPGYLKPGLDLSTITKSDDSPQIIDNLIIDMAVSLSVNKGYFLGLNGKLYEMSGLTTESWNADFDGASHYYYAIPNATVGYRTIMYNISGTPYLFYAYKTAAQGDVGTYNLTDTFNPDFLSTDVGTGAGALVAAPIDMMEWKALLFISHGQYVGRYNGSTDTWARHELNLGEGWEVTKLFPTEHYIGVCAWKKHSLASGERYRTEARIFFWDGISSEYSYWKPVADNKIDTAYNNNGDIFLLTSGRGAGATLRRLTDFGTSVIRKLKLNLTGSYTGDWYFNVNYPNIIEVYNNRLLLGTDFLVFSYGNEEENEPMILTNPWGQAYNANARIGMVKQVWSSRVYISFFDGTKYYLLKEGSTSSTRAKYRGTYTDFGQKVRLNYVKFYFKPLASGDSVTPTLDLDYGTSFTLRDPRRNSTINYTDDGAITSKRFDIKKDCHAVRPVLNWTSGKTAFSKIIIDYDFVEDK